MFCEGAIFLGEDWAVSQSLLSNRQIMSNLAGGWIPHMDQHLEIFHDGIVEYGDAVVVILALERYGRRTWGFCHFLRRPVVKRKRIFKHQRIFIQIRRLVKR